MPPDDVSSTRRRTLRIGAVAFVLLAAPFLVFGGMMFLLKARVELSCEPGLGACVLVHQSLVTREKVDQFTVAEMKGATVERNRSSRQGSEPIYRPVLETTRGSFPLSYRWLEKEADAQRTANTVNRFRANPMGGGGRGFTLFHDHRRTPMLVGSAFSGVGLVLLAVSVWLALKARRAGA